MVRDWICKTFLQFHHCPLWSAAAAAAAKEVKMCALAAAKKPLKSYISK
jgi:hypothetical protein